MSIKEAFAKLAERLDHVAYMESSSKVAKALGHVADEARAIARDIEADEHVKRECAVWKQAARNAQGPTLAADLQTCRDAAEKLKADRAELSKELEVVNAKLSYAVAEATRQDVVREKLKAELSAMGETVAAQAERREWLEKELEAAKTAADVAIARAEAAEAKLLTPEEAQEIAETYDGFVRHATERPSFYGEELDAIRRATRSA